MPVNDDEPRLAETNCALCSIAGIVGTTAQTERTRMGALLGPVPNQELITAQYGRTYHRPLRGNETDLELQIAGVMHYMHQTHNMAGESLIGGLNNRLSAEQVTAAIRRYALGTTFIYLVTAGPGRGGAHWIVARRAGATGIEYTDYQLDTAEEATDFITYNNKKSSDPNLVGHGPNTTANPMEAFGMPSRNENRMVVIAFGRPRVFKSSRVLLSGK